MKQTAEQILSAGREIARRATPYFRPMLLKLVMRETPGLGTVGVTKHAVFLWDRSFVEKVTNKQMAGLFIHEVMHLWLKHSKRLGSRKPGPWNRACDRAINPGILELGLELPGGQLRGVMPADIGKANGLTADEYYTENEHQESPPCGSCAGNPVDGEPDEAAAALDPEARTEVEIDRTARQVAEAIRDAAKTPGKVPGAWKRYADEVLAPPQVPWQERLAYATRRAVAFRAGGVLHRYDAPSRRQAGLGYGAGRPVLARLRAPVPHVTIAIDTSGSMGAAEMGAALSEAQGILRAIGAEVNVLVCDAAVHAEGRARSASQIGRMLAGGGGTDFRPVFERVVRAQPRPDVLVFLTDGYGPAPAAPPPGIATIWALVGPSVMTPAPWGEVVRIEPKRAA